MVDEKQLNMARAAAGVLCDSIKTMDRGMAKLHFPAQEGQEARLVLVFLGEERVGKVLPAADRLCPDEVVREGVRV